MSVSWFIIIVYYCGLGGMVVGVRGYLLISGTVEEAEKGDAILNRLSLLPLCSNRISPGIVTTIVREWECIHLVNTLMIFTCMFLTVL